MPRIAVVGGGITGLAAAWELSGGARPSTAHEIVVFEHEPHLGGKLRASTFAGVANVDEAADMFLARVPWGVQLARELGIADTLTSPIAGSAYVVWNGRLHPIPDGLVLGVPKGLGGLARSSLLSVRGKLRAAIEPLLPRHPIDHDSLGRLIRDRFGDEVLERLVDPLIGSINAGDADALSLADSVPQLHAAAVAHRSLLLGLRSALPPAAGPVFFAPGGGMAAFVTALATQLAERRVDLRTSRTVERITPQQSGVRIDDETFDGVIIATPAFVAARQLGVEALRAVEYAGVVMLTVAVHGEVPVASGYLIPKPQQEHVTAVSFGSHKWPRWVAGPNGSERPPTVLRISLGRHGRQQPLTWDDERVVSVAMEEIGRHLGTSLSPGAVRVTRWERAFPQYAPGHSARIAEIRNGLAPTVRLAGAAYEGIGVPACIRQGREAAAALSQILAEQAE